ncbi:hypothetical protein HXX76_005805 [Chlamydomonas incerta]|uniref:Uncharacterized protein n=1 Tax=Chlamydomonas incerta TaxID=51695 RepID=A0A835TH66_CHLIN|nr:hypothetical protein HXX76_005805 [Chlamydomonas incerta]|eukprot:KAG2438201.1 hypothetical protein HXX76_005805 [Chlamydomonas incerta]
MTISGEVFAGWRPGQASPLARTRRCRFLTVRLSAPEGDPSTPLLAALVIGGVDAAVAAGIRSLEVWSDGGFPTLFACASMLGGRLPNVRKLVLDPAGDWDWPQGDAYNASLAYSALRAALPQLETLELPCTPILRGLEAFAGSGLTSVQATAGCGNFADGNLLERKVVRSLAQLTQLRHLELWLCKPEEEAQDRQELGGAQVDDGDAPPPAADEDDVATLARLDACSREQLLSLRLLLCTAPAALETLKISGFEMQINQDGEQHDEEDGEEDRERCGELRELVFRFTPAAAAGRSVVAAVELGQVEGTASLNFLAAALLPRLAVTGQRRLPMLRLGGIEVESCGFRQLQRPFMRQAAMCDRVELGTFTLSCMFETARSSLVLDTLAAVRAVVQLCGWPSQQLSVWRHPWEFTLSRPGAWDGAAKGGRGSSTSGSGSSASGGVAAAPASASASSPALSLATVTAEQLLRATSERLWAAATEGPLVKQLACGRSGHAVLRAWLAAVAAGLDDDGSSTAGAASLASCAFLPTEALVLAQCSLPKHVPLLARAVSAAGRLAPGSLRVSLLRVEWSRCHSPWRQAWMTAGDAVLRELWGSRREAAAHGVGADAGGGGGSSSPTAGAQEQRRPLQWPGAGAAGVGGRRGPAAGPQADAADFEALRRLLEGAVQMRTGVRELG